MFEHVLGWICLALSGFFFGLSCIPRIEGPSARELLKVSALFAIAAALFFFK